MTHPHTALLAAALVTLSLGVAACGGSSAKSTSAPAASAPSAPASGPGAPAAPSGAPAKVAIVNFKFAPAQLTVSRGTSVSFTNSDSAPHTATARDGSFDSGTLNQGQSKTLTLSKAGTFAYYCQFHAFMNATVTVK